MEVREELERLQNKAREVNGYIKEVKDCIESSKSFFDKGDPVDINNIPMFYIGKERWDEDCEPTGPQKYYAYLLYYREVLKEIEKEIKEKKLLLKTPSKIVEESAVPEKGTITSSIEWYYPIKRQLPPENEVVYIWDNNTLFRGVFRTIKGTIKGKVETHKTWEVYGKGGLSCMQSTVDAWTYLSSIRPPEVK